MSTLSIIPSPGLLKLERGLLHSIQFTIKDRTTGAAIDITGDTLTLTADADRIGGTEIFSKVNTTHSDAANGKTTFAITVAETNDNASAFTMTRWYVGLHWADGGSADEDVPGDFIFEIYPYPMP